MPDTDACCFRAGDVIYSYEIRGDIEKPPRFDAFLTTIPGVINTGLSDFFRVLSVNLPIPPEILDRYILAEAAEYGLPPPGTCDLTCVAAAAEDLRLEAQGTAIPLVGASAQKGGLFTLLGTTGPAVLFVTAEGAPFYRLDR